MRELLYVPPGRRDGDGRPSALLVPELANPIFPALAQAIETRAAPSGLASILCNTAGAAFREVDYVHMLLDRRVDGMIFISCEMTNLRGDHAHYAQLVGRGRADRLRERRDRTRSTSRPSASTSAPPARSRRSTCSSSATSGSASSRARALPADAARRPQAGAARSPARHRRRRARRARGVRHRGRRPALRRRCSSRREPPTGVICSSDLMAIGALHEAARLGLRVPDDLSIVGFDGIEAAKWTEPG